MGLLLRVLVFAGLAADAYIHWTFAPDMAFVGEGGAVTGDVLFRAQAVVAALAGLLVLAWARRWTYAIAFLVAASAFGAVILYYMVDLGTLGPIPDMYDPAWYAEKTISSIGEAVAALAAVAGMLTAGRGRTDGTPSEEGPVQRQRT
ncbi:hypothetical protein [Spirillospora sp. NPDC029432]|uniref:hypothetical protein n=1 Tax=Spirillospora sp. NPDC029432 TaxID=3154599 RepID=UPI0034534C68